MEGLQSRHQWAENGVSGPNRRGGADGTGQVREYLGLAQSDEVKNFAGETIFLSDGDYIFLYMPIDQELPEYVFSEGYIIHNPYKFKSYKWCCKLTSKFEFIEDYESKFNELK